MAKLCRARFFACSVLCAAIGVPNSAAAQQAADSDDPGRLPDIVVTGRLRAENLQDVPLAITAFDQRAIEQRQLDTVADLQKFVPNVQLSDINFSGNTLGVSIRGISFADLEKTFENAIAVSIDGVFLGTNTGAAFEANDLESVEVLRGPQGTLQGRNSIGGAINIRRTRPTEDMGMRGILRYGRYDNLDFTGILNSGRISDGPLMVKGFVTYKRGDSHSFNLTRNEQEEGKNYITGGVAIALRPDGGNWDALLTVEYLDDDSRAPSSVNLTKPALTPEQQQQIIETIPPQFRFGAALGFGGNLCDAVLVAFGSDTGCDTASLVPIREAGFDIGFAPFAHVNAMDQWAATFEIRGQLGDVALTGITGYRKSNELLLEENSGAPPIPFINAALFVAARDTDYAQFSQELRANFDIGDDLADVVAGFYYLWTDYSLVPAAYKGIRSQAFLLDTPIQNFVASQELNSYAGFVEAIWNLGDTVRLTTGARYTIETKRFAIQSFAPTQFDVSEKDTWKRLTGRVLADWRPNDDVLVYGGWSRGFRSGGFNGRAGSERAAQRPYDPETVDSFEVGGKFTLAEGTIRLNPTAFYASYRDVQQDIIVAAPGGQGTDTFVENAGAARIWGLELEAQARLGRLNLNAAIGHLNAKYTKFEIEDPANPGQIIDVKDERQWRRAPDWTVSFGGDYTIPAGPGDLVLFSNISYIGEFATSPVRDPFNREIITAQTRVDASLSYEIQRLGAFREARFTVFGRDMLAGADGRLNATLNAGIFFFGVQVPARTWGIEMVLGF